MPIEAPPSYRGTAVKYSYKITIATQKVGSHIKMVRIPFRVLPISPIINMQDLAVLCGNETTEELQPTNPFSEERKIETPLSMALQVLQVKYMVNFKYDKCCSFIRNINIELFHYQPETVVVQ